MFKKNTQHTQTDIFGLFNSLPESMKKKIESSEEKYFYRLIFSTIDEEIFAPLYADTTSRPNAPVNEFVCKMHRRKLKMRGAFKASIFALCIAMGVNFGRIYRLQQAVP